MKEHLDRAIHNEEFLNVIENHTPNLYFDWKVIVAFYSALHYLRALEHRKKSHIGGGHKEFFAHLNPDSKTAKMPIDKAVFECYLDMFNMAHTSRYHKFKDIKKFQELMKFNLSLAKQHLDVIKKYVKTQGVK